MNLSAFSIRDAAICDLSAIVDIYNSTVPSRMVTADTAPVTIESKKSWFTEHSPQLRPLWVLEDKEGVCGWVDSNCYPTSKG